MMYEIIGKEFDELLKDMRMHPVEWLLTERERKKLPTCEELEKQYSMEVK